MNIESIKILGFHRHELQYDYYQYTHLDLADPNQERTLAVIIDDFLLHIPPTTESGFRRISDTYAIIVGYYHDLGEVSREPPDKKWKTNRLEAITIWRDGKEVLTHVPYLTQVNALKIIEQAETA